MEKMECIVTPGNYMKWRKKLEDITIVEFAKKLDVPLEAAKLTIKAIEKGRILPYQTA